MNTDKKSFNDEISRLHFAEATAVASATSASSIQSESALKNMLKNPSANAVNIANYSKEIRRTNGIYDRIINYLKSMLTYDHLIYPVIENQDKSDSENTKEAFMNSAILVDRINIKYNFPIFVGKMLTHGTVYVYKLEDTDGIAFMELPIEICRISYIKNGVFRYEVDVSKLNDALVEALPTEFESAYNQYRNGSTDSFKEGKWYEVSDKGVAFTIDENVLIQSGLSTPPFSSTLLDALRLDKAKENMETIDNLDNSKIVHSKVPVDDKGRPLMEKGLVRTYHQQLKQALPEGSVAITNPFDTEGVNVAGSGVGREGKFSLLDKSKDNMFDGTGISSLLFAGDGKSSKALDRSIEVDAQWLYATVLPLFTNYVNYELKQGSKKGVIWKIKFITTSHFSKNEDIKTSKDQLSFGGSRIEYLASTGMTPLEVANMFFFEQEILNIDQYMISKETSYTKSGNSDNSGAPESKDPSDDTIRIKDAE